MSLQKTGKTLWRCALGMCVAGTVFGASCSSEQIEAVAAGIQAAASQLDDRDDDISFGDWLLDELEDL
jgi:hypothetical protein